MELEPMIHVESVEPAVIFYEALGAHVEYGSPDGDFVMMTLGGGRFSLLAHPPNPEQNEGLVELNFEADEPLDVVEQQLRSAGVSVVKPVQDLPFGRQLQVAAPDGLLVKINELRGDLYT